MARLLYNRFIKPVTRDSDQAEREIVLNYLLVGMIGLSVVAFVVTLLGPLISEAPFHPVRLIGMAIAIMFIVGLYGLARYRGQYKPIAILLTLFIIVFGCLVAARWSLWDPHSVLLLGLGVVIAGILIGARYSLYATCGIAAIMAYLVHGEGNGSLHPDLSWLNGRPQPGDVIAFAAILLVIALVSWLFNRQMELSLRRAERSEKALQRQAASLEIKVEKRAQQLEAAQLEKMQEVYRFAELGRLSTALFHDLANHLSSVSVDIEGLSGKSQSDIMHRISQNIGHIDTIVQRVRRQIGGKTSIEVFSVTEQIDEVLKILAPAAEQAAVEVALSLDKSVKSSLLYKGDTIRFRQIILNLVSNAIEAYSEHSRKGEARTVAVGLSRQQTTLAISVSDHGRGIRASEQAKVFRPFYSTKAKGAGIGLFLVQQIVEQDFGGSINLTSGKRVTTFTASLPKSYYA